MSGIELVTRLFLFAASVIGFWALMWRCDLKSWEALLASFIIVGFFAAAIFPMDLL